MSLARVDIDASQFPENVRRDLFESLASRRINHKFHYDSLKQTQKWIALHEAFSPARNDPHGAEIYQQSFAAAAGRLAPGPAHVIGLGCGAGQKDTALLRLLRDSGRRVCYTPVDVSVAMVLVARQSALAVVTESDCFPMVCDLATAGDLRAVLTQTVGGERTPVPDRVEQDTPPGSPGQTPALNRLITFFGMIPNFEPDAILPKLANLIGPGDQLLFSANLAPGNDYAAGVRKVLPLYDNELTRDWLMTFLLDLGVEKSDGTLHFVVEDQTGLVHLKRIAAYFKFARDRVVAVEAQQFGFAAGESIRLFFSYRHTPALVSALLLRHGLAVKDQWITPSQEEGLFLISRRA